MSAGARDEALRLTLMLREEPAGALPETDALVALMCFHAARFDARVDGMGGLLLLEEQDPARWDRELIQRGLLHLGWSARGETLTRYHLEAGVAPRGPHAGTGNRRTAIRDDG